MNNNKYNEEKIYDYLDGKLTDKENDAFELEMKQDNKLAQKVEELMLARDLVNYKGRKKLLNTVKEATGKTGSSTISINNTSSRTIAASKTPWLRNFSIAASFLILISATYFLFPRDSNIDTGQMLADFHSTNYSYAEDYLNRHSTSGFLDDNPNNLPKGSKEEIFLISDALKGFKLNKWQFTKEKLVNYNTSFPKGTYNDIALYYLANSYFNLGQYMLAIEHYNILLNSKFENNQIRQAAEYELGLSWLSIEINKTKEIMESIAKNNSHLHQEQAQLILERI